VAVRLPPPHSSVIDSLTELAAAQFSIGTSGCQVGLSHGRARLTSASSQVLSGDERPVQGILILPLSLNPLRLPPPPLVDDPVARPL
jgi:hypothetical protein